MKNSKNSGESSSATKCELCGKSVLPHDEKTWKQVTGWVGGPRKDSMRLREDTGKYAHDTCVAKLQEGQAPDQPSMFDDLGPPISSWSPEPWELKW